MAQPRFFYFGTFLGKGGRGKGPFPPIHVHRGEMEGENEGPALSSLHPSIRRQVTEAWMGGGWLALVPLYHLIMPSYGRAIQDENHHEGIPSL